MSEIYGKISKFSIYVLAAAILIFGIALRIGPHIDFSHAIDGNLSSYYFGKFNQLMENGRLGPMDIWQWAPGTHPENAPPGLSYAAGALYFLAKPFFPDILPIQFANVFPVIVYALFGISAFLLFSLVEKNALAGIVVLSAISFSQIFASHTEYAYFAQETLGALFLFLSIYFLINVRRSKFDFAAAVISITFLVLSWQQFPIFYFVGAALIAILFLQKNFGAVKLTAVALALPILFSEFIARVVMGIEYSPVGMIKEIALGAWLLKSRDPDFLSVMVNPDWLRAAPSDFFKWYGPLASVLVPLGIAASLVRIKNTRYLSALVFSVFGMALFFQFRKEKIFAFAMMLPVIAAAVEAISFEPMRLAKDAFSKIRRTLVYQRRLIYAAAFGVFTAVFLILIWPRISSRLWPPASPAPDVSFQKTENPDGTIDIYVRLTNRGGITYSAPGMLWNLNTGLHLEVENADILEFESKSRLLEDEWYHHHVYPYIRLGDLQFVETRYKQLKYGEWGDARLKIKPLGPPVNVYYRGWLTDTPCTEDYVRKSAAGLLPRFDTGLEKCIIRFPRYGDENYPRCPIDIASRRVGSGTGEFDLKALPCAAEKIL